MTDASENRKNDPEANPWEETIRAVFSQGYEEMVGRFLRAPQLGLFREHVQEILGAVEAFHRLITALADFGRRFGKPFQEAVEEFSRTLPHRNPPLTESKALYDAFVAFLSEKYETFLGSKEGIDGVAGMIDTYLIFKERLDATAVPWLKFWAIPTRQEMTDVHRRIHDLKKQNRNLQAVLKQQVALIENLQQRIGSLETSGTLAPLKKLPSKGRTGSGPRKNPSRKRSAQSTGSD